MTKILAQTEIAPGKNFLELRDLFSETREALKNLPEESERILLVEQIRAAVFSIMEKAGVHLSIKPITPASSRLSLIMRVLTPALEKLEKQTDEKTVDDLCLAVHREVLSIVNPLLEHDVALEKCDVTEKALRTPLEQLPFGNMKDAQAHVMKIFLEKNVYRYAGNLLYVDLGGRLKICDMPDFGPVRRSAVKHALRQIQIPLGKTLSVEEIDILRDFAIASRAEMMEKEEEERVRRIQHEQAMIARRSPGLDDLQPPDLSISPEVRARVEPPPLSSHFLRTPIDLYLKPLREILGDDVKSEDRELHLASVIINEWRYSVMGDFIETYQDEKLHVRTRIRIELVKKLEKRFGEKGAQKILNLIEKEFQDKDYTLGRVLNLTEQKAFKDFKRVK